MTTPARTPSTARRATRLWPVCLAVLAALLVVPGTAADAAPPHPRPAEAGRRVVDMSISALRGPCGSSVSIEVRWRRSDAGARVELHVQREIQPERIEQVAVLDDHGRAYFQSPLTLSDNTYRTVIRSSAGKKLGSSPHSAVTGLALVDPASPTADAPVTFSGTLGTALRRPVVLQRQLRSGHWEDYASTTSESDGDFAVIASFQASTNVRLHVPRFTDRSGTTWYAFTTARRALTVSDG